MSALKLPHRAAIGAASALALVFAVAPGPASAFAVEPPTVQEAPAERPRQTIASILLVGVWSAPDFQQTWTFRPDARGGLSAVSEHRVGMNSVGYSVDFEPTVDGRELVSPHNPPDRIAFDEAGGVAVNRPIRPEIGQAGQHIRLRRLRSPDASWADPFVGRWNANGGVLVFTISQGVLHGRLERTDANGAPALVRRFAFVRTEEGEVIGAWAGSDGWAGAPATIALAPDGNSLHGRLDQMIGRPETWSARRLTAETGPSRPSGPAPSPGPTPAPSPAQAPPTSPPEASPFRPLSGFGVRFDRLERPRSGGVVRAVVTLRNETRQVQHLPSGTFRAILTDADGAGQERNQLWRGSGEPAQLFNGTPALQPGGELTVRFTFNPDIRDLDSLVLMRGQDQVEFDLGGR